MFSHQIFITITDIPRKCYFCSLELKDIISHQLFSCTKLEDKRRLLRSKYLLYNFPADKLNNKNTFYKAVLSKKIWTKCFSEFLADIDPRNQSLESDVGPRGQTDMISV